MSEDPKSPNPNNKNDDDPVGDLKRGVGLLFKAAKNAARGAKDSVHTDKVEKAFKSGVDELHKTLDRLQSDKLEGAVKASLQEIGRALGNVAETLERELTPKEHQDKPPKQDDEKKP